MLDKITYLCLLLSHRRDQKGATATEYGLLVALIAIVIFAAVQAFGTQLSGFFDRISAVVGGWNP